MTAILKGAMLALGLLLILGSAWASDSTFGTKVEAGDSDIGLPLSPFSALVGATGATASQINVGVSYWDIGSAPGVYDDKDPVYLQFGASLPFGGSANRIVRDGNIRLTDWGPYLAGSKVKAGDSDIGQQLLPWIPPANPSTFVIGSGFYYMNVAGGPGYDLGDPVYLKLAPPALPFITSTNDIRITSFDGFPAGSKVSLGDPDAARPLVPLWAIPPLPVAGQPKAAAPRSPVARLAFFNANGNVNAAGAPIYDGDDPVYLSIAVAFGPGTHPVVPNDIRLS